jgi:hypothetical protein
MLEDRNVPTGETRDALRLNAEQRAVTLVNEIHQRTRDIGDVNRKKVTASIMTEALLAAYLEGRSSCMLDKAIIEAKEARDHELESAKTLLAQEAVAASRASHEAAMTTIGQFTLQSVQMFTEKLSAPILFIARKTIWWGVGVAVVHALVIAALVALLLRK